MKNEPSNVGQKAEQSVGDKTEKVTDAPKSAASKIPGTQGADEAAAKKPSTEDIPGKQSTDETANKPSNVARTTKGEGQQELGSSGGENATEPGRESSKQPSQSLHDVKTGTLGSFGTGAVQKGNPSNANSFRQPSGTIGSAGELRAAKTGTSAPNVAQAHGAATPTGGETHVTRSSTHSQNSVASGGGKEGGAVGGQQQQPQGGAAQGAQQDAGDDSEFDAAKPGAGEKADRE